MSNVNYSLSKCSNFPCYSRKDRFLVLSLGAFYLSFFWVFFWFTMQSIDSILVFPSRLCGHWSHCLWPFFLSALLGGD